MKPIQVIAVYGEGKTTWKLGGTAGEKPRGSLADAIAEIISKMRPGHMAQDAARAALREIRFVLPKS